MPRKVRRTHSSPLQHLLMYAKKKGHLGHNFPGQLHGYAPQAPRYYSPRTLPFAKNQYPQGGDDFDQGHEEVNHVMVPHGKGITHAVSFGNGYIPFDNYKNPPSVSHHHNYRPESPKDAAYSPTVNLPAGPVYSQAYLSQQADAYVENNDNNDENELQEGSNDRAAQAYSNGGALNEFPKAGAIGAPPYGGVGVLPTSPVPQPVGLQGIPPATIGGGKQEIVLRDTIAFDEYNKQVAELMRKWPGNLGNNNFIAGVLGNNQQGTHQFNGVSRQYNANALLGGVFYGGSAADSSLNRDQAQKGYAVKEDVVDTAPHDFRNAPLQTSPVQPLAVQIPQQPIQIYQQPGQSIFPQQLTQQIQPQPLTQIIQHQPSQQIIQHQPSPQIIQHQLSRQMVQPQPSRQLIQPQASQQIINRRPVNPQTLQKFLPHSQRPINYGIPNFHGLVRG